MSGKKRVAKSPLLFYRRVPFCLVLVVPPIAGERKKDSTKGRRQMMIRFSLITNAHRRTGGQDDGRQG